MRRTWFLATVTVLAVAAWFALAGAPRRRSPVSKVPGIVVICLDTLRGDGIDAGPGTNGLPSLRRFAEGATRFADAVAPCSWTGPSVATVVTGLDPWNHGVLEVSDATRLAASVPTLASTFLAAGWSTAALTGGGWLAEGAGIPTGFETYAADFDEAPPAASIGRWASRRPLDRPFFLFVHTYAPHDPYGDKMGARSGDCPPPSPDVEALAAELAAVDPAAGADPSPWVARYVRARYGDPCAHAALRSALGRPRFDALVDRCWPWLDGGWRDDPAGPAVVAGLREAYFGAGLASVDARLSATLDALGGLPDGTVVVVLSDHGEAFGEHGPLYHARFLGPELTHVALVVRGPGFPAGAVVAGTCGLVDVAPTLLEVAGVAAPRAVDGRSLLPLVRDGGPGRPIPSVVVPRRDAAAPEDGAVVRATVRDATLAWSGVFDTRARAWRDERWFDRVADRGEHVPLPTPSPGAAFAAELARVRTAVASRYLRLAPAIPPGR
ncbi:MAG: sulfatase [Planctomycetia bacterium]|nr:sulfatase [Planctomycetia bacterium]